MQVSRRAVIDIGTNSVKLLVAEVKGDEAIPLLEQSKQTRLGEGFYQSLVLRPEAIQRTVAAVADFVETAKSFGPEFARIIATSAAREARNQADFEAAIQRAVGQPVEIISGDQEAEWIFQGVRAWPDFAERPILVLDAGGGSTELIFGANGKMLAGASLDLGTVRLLERFPPSDPPRAKELASLRNWLDRFLDEHIESSFRRTLRERAEAPLLVGTGGTSSILARIHGRLESFERHRIDETRLTDQEVSRLVDRLWSLPLDPRKQIIGLPAKRADVILMGSAIFEAVLRNFQITQMRCSTRGLRFAALSASPETESSG